jgi:hypothetical protein
VIRAGSGFFYDRSGSAVIFDLLRYDGLQLHQFLITSLTFALQSSFAGEARGKSNACTTAELKTPE